MSTIAPYLAAFQSLQQQQLGLADTAFAAVLQHWPDDQTALEFRKLLAACGDTFPYQVIVREPVVVCYRSSQIALERLETLLQQALAAASYMRRWPSLQPLTLFVMVVDDSIQVAHADYKKRPLVPKIRLHPLSHPGTVAHEVAHLAFPNANRFLAEGFAMYVASCLSQWQTGDVQSYFRAALSDTIALLPLAELCREHEEHLHYFAPSFTHYQKIQAYYQAASFIAYLLERFTWDKFWALAQRLDNTYAAERIIAVFAEALGVSLEQLETDWKRSCFPDITPAGDARSQAILQILQQPAAATAGDLRDVAHLDALVCECEITLPLQMLATLRKKLDSMCAEAGTPPHYVYYTGRVCLALLNSLEQEIDWLYQDLGQIGKSVAGFAGIRQAGIDMVEHAIALLQPLATSDPGTPVPAGEIHRLLGELYGRLIKYKGKFVAITYGALCGRELDIAWRSNHQNMRALTALGRLKLFTPKLFGGGIEAAKKYFRSASEIHPLFNEAHIGLALCCYLENDMQAFCERLQQALAIHPGDRCAQKLLHKFAQGDTIIKI